VSGERLIPQLPTIGGRSVFEFPRFKEPAPRWAGFSRIGLWG